MPVFYRLLLLIGLLSGMPALAQTTYPVQVNTHLLPPYTPYLSDYASGTREKLTLTLINRDQLKPTLNVRLRLSITAPGGIKIHSVQAPYTEPLLVEAGIPLRLPSQELAPYFLPQNLSTQGGLREGKLPEGMVEFCLQVVEAYTNQPLSACARAFITSQKPPLLSLPHNNESIAFREPLNLLFQWTPRHQGVTYVEYEFILKELTDNGMPPRPLSPTPRRSTGKPPAAPPCSTGPCKPPCCRENATPG